MASSRGKDILFRSLSDTAKVLGALALVVVSDIWTLHHPKEWRKTKTPEWWREGCEFADKRGIVAAAAAGYGQLVEAVAVMGQTKTLSRSRMYPYQRKSADGVIPPTAAAAAGAADKLGDHSIVFLPEVDLDQTTAQSSGRMAHLMYEGEV